MLEMYKRVCTFETFKPEVNACQFVKALNSKQSGENSGLTVKTQYK